MKKAVSMPSSHDLLRSTALRVTPGRIELLDVLSQEHEPLTVREIAAKLSMPLNEVTLYRALETLVAAGLVSQIDLQHGHAHFEIAATRKHHHHLVCTDCGIIEDFTNDACESLLTSMVKKSKSFSVYTSHSMELFGLCKSCA